MARGRLPMGLPGTLPGALPGGYRGVYPGGLPEGLPGGHCTGPKNAGIVIFIANIFYTKINNMHILARIFAPARITDGTNYLFLIIFYNMLHHFTLKSITCTFWPGILPLQGSPTGQKNGWGPWAHGPLKGTSGPWAPKRDYGPMGP